jgi:biotin operon repressor
MSQTSSRLLQLLSLLQARRDWPGNELADRLEVSARTIRRDIERLRHLGYPVDSLTGPAGGYRLRAGSAMPPLLLDHEEAIAIAVGLRTAARASVTRIEETAVRALVKLEPVLPSHVRRRVRALGSATISPPVGGPTVDPQLLTVIAAACRDSECLRFAYRGRDGTDSRREVEPLGRGRSARRRSFAPSTNYPELRIIHPMPSRGLCLVGVRRPAFCLLSGLGAMSGSANTAIPGKTSSWSRARSRPGLCWAGPCGERTFLEGEVGVKVDLGWSGRCCICLYAIARRQAFASGRRCAWSSKAGRRTRALGHGAGVVLRRDA